MPALIALAAAVLGTVGPATPASAAKQTPPTPFVSGWLPYWNVQGSLESVTGHAALFQDASPFVFEATGTTTFDLKLSTDTWRQMRTGLRDAGVENIPTVSTQLSADEFAQIVTDRDRRRAHADALVALVQQYGLDGIDLDYESINFGTAAAKNQVRTYYPLLLRRLHNKLSELGAVASVTVASRTSDTDPNWWVYDYAALGGFADRVRIMTYDFHWSGGSAGPIAPKWWVADVAAYAARVIDPAKVSLGMPAYGRDWFVEAVSGKCPASARTTISRTTREMNSFAAAIGVTPVWREHATSASFTYVRTYTTSTGATCRAKRQVWFDNARSLATKSQLVDRFGLRGIAVWALGGEGAASWPGLEAYGRELAQAG